MHSVGAGDQLREATQQQEPWPQIGHTTLLNAPVVLRSTRDAYTSMWTWIVACAINLGTLALFRPLDIRRNLSGEADNQAMYLAYSLTIALAIACVVKLIEMRWRFISIEVEGLRIRLPFRNELLTWDSLERIEWWPLHFRGKRYTFYSFLGVNSRKLFTLGGDVWARLDEGLGHITAYRQTAPVRVKPRVSLRKQIFVLLLFALAYGLSFLAATTWSRMVGLTLFHVAWSIIVRSLSEYDRRSAWFYLLMISALAIVVLVWLTGPRLWEILTWWLYSPLIEVVISFAITDLPHILKKMRANQVVS